VKVIVKQIKLHLFRSSVLGSGYYLQYFPRFTNDGNKCWTQHPSEV